MSSAQRKPVLTGSRSENWPQKTAVPALDTCKVNPGHARTPEQAGERLRRKIVRSR